MTISKFNFIIIKHTMALSILFSPIAQAYCSSNCCILCLPASITIDTFVRFISYRRFPRTDKIEEESETRHCMTRKCTNKFHVYAKFNRTETTHSSHGTVSHTRSDTEIQREEKKRTASTQRAAEKRNLIKTEFVDNRKENSSWYSVEL